MFSKVLRITFASAILFLQVPLAYAGGGTAPEAGGSAGSGGAAAIPQSAASAGDAGAVGTRAALDGVKNSPSVSGARGTGAPAKGTGGRSDRN